jgi:hypothetical protein
MAAATALRGVNAAVRFSKIRDAHLLAETGSMEGRAELETAGAEHIVEHTASDMRRMLGKVQTQESALRSHEGTKAVTLRGQIERENRVEANAAKNAKRGVDVLDHQVDLSLGKEDNVKALQNQLLTMEAAVPKNMRSVGNRVADTEGAMQEDTRELTDLVAEVQRHLDHRAMALKGKHMETARMIEALTDLFESNGTGLGQRVYTDLTAALFEDQNLTQQIMGSVVPQQQRFHELVDHLIADIRLHGPGETSFWYNSSVDFKALVSEMEEVTEVLKEEIKYKSAIKTAEIREIGVNATKELVLAKESAKARVVYSTRSLSDLAKMLGQEADKVYGGKEVTKVMLDIRGAQKEAEEGRGRLAHMKAVLGLTGAEHMKDAMDESLDYLQKAYPAIRRSPLLSIRDTDTTSFLEVGATGFRAVQSGLRAADAERDAEDQQIERDLETLARS